MDGSGIPTDDDECPKTERRYEACAGAGCHVTAASARGFHELAEQRILPLIAQLEAMVAAHPDTSRTDGRYTSAEGSLFNIKLARSSGAMVHNPFLIEALLRASMAQMQQDYEPAAALRVPPASPAMQRLLDGAWARGAYRHSGSR